MRYIADHSTHCAGNHPLSGRWQSAEEFAGHAGLSVGAARRILRRCYEGQDWRGAQLTVRRVPAGGGPGGMRYEVDASTLPGNMQERADGQHPLTPSLPNIAPGELQAPRTQKLAPWKLQAVQHVIHAGDHGSRARADAVKELAASLVYPEGEKRGKRVSERVIRAWVKAYEADGQGGYLALARKLRSDKGSARVTISKKWDQAAIAAGITPEQRTAILEKIEKAVQAEFKSGNSRQIVQLNVMPVLLAASQAAGMDLAPAALMDVCKLPPNFIERFRPFKAASIYRKDAGKSAAIQTPRIRRDRSHLKPMEFVAGDVHHIDIAFQRADGSLCTIKAITWQDLATNRIFISPVLLDKGKGVRREHVLRSFADMCADPSWGVPTRLYLDNGSEYALLDELTGDLLKLKQVVGRAFEIRPLRDLAPGIQKARAYNPQAKVIETVFAVLEKKVLPQLPGHMGGDRMKKKTENQGKAPAPYDGDYGAFVRDLKLAIDYYHRAPQSGHLNGKAPNDLFARFISEGWQSVTLDPRQLEVAFSKVATRCVQPGGVITVDGQVYRHDELLRYGGTDRVTVRVPLMERNPTRVYVYSDDDKFICIAVEPKVFAFGDRAGTEEQQRQAKEFRKQMAEYGGVPSDGRDSMQAVVDLLPEPQATSAGLISINEDIQEAARQAGSLRSTPESEDYERERRGQRQIMAKLRANISKRAAGG